MSTISLGTLVIAQATGKSIVDTNAIYLSIIFHSISLSFSDNISTHTTFGILFFSKTGISIHFS
jgi:hypothetical protein